MKLDLYIEHGTLFVFDSSERSPGHRWTADHVRQWFARSRSSVNVRAIFAEDGIVEEVVDDPAELPACEVVVEASIHSPSGRIVISGTDPVDIPVWSGSPGWLRISIGQRMLDDDTPPRILVVLHAESSTSELPTRVWLKNKEVEGAFVETAEPG